MSTDEEFRAKLKSIQFGGARSPQSLMEKRWARDMPAYQRLRMDGLQPKQIDGCAELETRAETQWEVNYGHLVHKSLMPQVIEGMNIAREMVDDIPARRPSPDV